MIHVTPIAISATSQQYACSVTENLCQLLLERRYSAHFPSELFRR